MKRGVHKRPNSGKVGRPAWPSKWSQERQDAICALIAAGNYVEVACHAVGLGSRTFRRWMQLAEAGREPYVGFAAAVKNAEARNESDIISVVKEVAVGRTTTLRDKDGKAMLDHNGVPVSFQEAPVWQAGMRLLESRGADRWLRTEKRILVDKPKNAPFTMTLIPTDRAEDDLKMLRPVEPPKAAATNGNGHKAVVLEEEDD